MTTARPRKAAAKKAAPARRRTAPTAPKQHNLPVTDRQYLAQWRGDDPRWQHFIVTQPFLVCRHGNCEEPRPHFTLQAYPNAEFEWGAVPRAMDQMHEAKDLVIMPVEVKRRYKERTVYFVGSRAVLNDAVHDFKAWFSQEWPRQEEPTGFEQCFMGQELTYPFTGVPARPEPPTIAAWLALRNGVAWALEEDHAQAMYRIIADGPPYKYTLFYDRGR